MIKKLYKEFSIQEKIERLKQYRDTWEVGASNAKGLTHGLWEAQCIGAPRGIIVLMMDQLLFLLDLPQMSTAITSAHLYLVNEEIKRLEDEIESLTSNIQETKNES